MSSDTHATDSGAVIRPPPEKRAVSDIDDDPDFDIDLSLLETGDVAARRDELVSLVRDHAGRIARELAILQGGDYGTRDFDTARGTWTVKYDGGALQFLRFDGGRDDIYVVSTHRPPDPEALAEAMRDYPAFVGAYNAYVESLDGVLDDVEIDFPDVASTDTVVAERDRILDAVRSVCTDVAGHHHRIEGTEYGTFATRIDGTRWELKRDHDQVSYLRVGGDGGLYLLSQYQQPPASDVRELATDVPRFVTAFNEFVADVSSALSAVEF
jgi:hypothetical protein